MMRIALVHDYLVHVRGGERVLMALADLFPEADIFTLVFNAGGMGAAGRVLARRGPIRTSLVQRLPMAPRFFRLYLPFYPLAAQRVDLSGYDLVVSSSSAWAHGVHAPPGATHISYCHSPFRFAWSHYHELVGAKPLRAAVLRPLMARIREWDRAASSRVDAYVANSRVTQGRIARFYGRQSAVIPPPVELSRFRLAAASRDYYLVVSALMPYKRVDVAVAAFTRLGQKLRVVGDGPELPRLRAMAGPTVEFLGERTDQEVAELYAHCRALVFTPEEDFGIVPLEAMACGRPVIAYAAGGALETVVDGVTGAFFAQQTAESLAEVVSAVDAAAFAPERIRRHAQSFDTSVFKERFRAFVEEQLRGNARPMTSAH